MQKAFTFYLKVCKQTDECMDGYQSLSLRRIKNKRTKNKIHINKENTLNTKIRKTHITHKTRRKLIT